MTQEEKQLLIKDLCARLPYDVKIRTNEDDESYTLLAIHPNKDIAVIGLQFDDVFATSKIKIEDIKPYLRLMSSMTVEEKKEYNSFSKPTGHRKVWINRIDWLNRKMFDYRGLIEKGLAIEHELDGSHPATKGQRDLLFQKMKESGCEWDAEHKQLKKIEQKPNDKVEPRFKVKYAGSEYNVLEVRDIAGVTFYGIEDEPNHIDYVFPENCEIISGYAIKENGSPYPTKPAVFSEKKPAAWSEKDENYLQSAENACEYQ